MLLPPQKAGTTSRKSGAPRRLVLQVLQQLSACRVGSHLWIGVDGVGGILRQAGFFDAEVCAAAWEEPHRSGAGWQIATAYRRFDTFLSGAIKSRPLFLPVSKLVTRSTRFNGYAVSMRRPLNRGGSAPSDATFSRAPYLFSRRWPSGLRTLRIGPAGTVRGRRGGQREGKQARPGPAAGGDTFLLGARAARGGLLRGRATTLGGPGIPARDAGAVLT